LEERHVQKDWLVTVPLDILNAAEETQQRYTVLLVFIAGISLVVGGIGIMNIMLATVTERTREIGVRPALGAKRKGIMLPFLIDAIVQTTVGALSGVVVGVAVTYLAPLIATLFGIHLPAKLNEYSFLLSLGVAIAVGVLSGLSPAWRAAYLDPIEALRHE